MGSSPALTTSNIMKIPQPVNSQVSNTPKQELIIAGPLHPVHFLEAPGQFIATAAPLSTVMLKIAGPDVQVPFT